MSMINYYIMIVVNFKLVKDKLNMKKIFSYIKGNETDGIDDTLDVTNRILEQSTNELKRIESINKVLRLAYNDNSI